MLNLSLSAVARAPVRLRGVVAQDDPIWHDVDLVLAEPLRFDLEARMVGEGVLVRGEIRTALDATCRRCLNPVRVPVEESVDLLYEVLSAEEQIELNGEIYPLPERGDELDLGPAVREQLVLRAPDFVLCEQSCRGLCPTCGVDLNRESCDCVAATGSGPWEVLKQIKFD